MLLGLAAEIALIACLTVSLALFACVLWRQRRQRRMRNAMASVGVGSDLGINSAGSGLSRSSSWGPAIRRWWQRDEGRRASTLESAASTTHGGSLRAGLLTGSENSSSGDNSSSIGWRIVWRDKPRQRGRPDYSAYERIRVLGRGAYGAAILLRNRSTGDAVVCKELSLATMDAGHLEKIENEVRILASLSHPHVIEYRCSLPHRQQKLLCILMEYAQGGTLADFIWVHAQRKEPISESIVLRWVGQLASALRHLHDNRVLHRDLKTQNIFLTLDQQIKLGDFGVSRVMSAATAMVDTMVGTPYYMAPEVLQSAPYAEPADLWAFGVILYEVITLEKPFADANLGALVHHIATRDADTTLLANSPYPRALWTLPTCDCLLHRDPTLRLTLDALQIRIDEIDPPVVEIEPALSCLGVAPGQTAGPSRKSRLSEEAATVDADAAKDAEATDAADAADATEVAEDAESADAASEESSLQTERGNALGNGHAGSLEAVHGPLINGGKMSWQSGGDISPAASPHGVLPPATYTSEDVAQLAEMRAALGPLVSEAQLSLRELLGKGGFATVHRALYTQAGGRVIEVAVKRFATSLFGAKELSSFCKEVQLMHQLHHPNLLRMLGVSAAPGALSLVIEYMPRGSVYSWLRRDCRGVPPPLHLTLRILVDTAAGLAHLHGRSPRIAHRDIKSMNLLLAADLTVRLADFGLSREFHHTNAMSRVGTLQWVAPEVLLGKSYNHTCDLWSFGVVCWELLTALIPFDGMSKSELVAKVAVEGLRLPPPAGAPMLLLQVMARCWAKPTKRPSIEKIHRQLVQALQVATPPEAAPSDRASGRGGTSGRFMTG